MRIIFLLAVMSGCVATSEHGSNYADEQTSKDDDKDKDDACIEVCPPPLRSYTFTGYNVEQPICTRLKRDGTNRLTLRFNTRGEYSSEFSSGGCAQEQDGCTLRIRCPATQVPGDVYEVYNFKMYDNARLLSGTVDFYDERDSCPHISLIGSATAEL